MTEILDVSRDNDTGEITQFLVIGEDGVPDPKAPSPENLLLYDPEDELPFDGGMNSFFSGDAAVQIQDDPEILVSQTGDEYSYILSVDGSPVETTPQQASDVLDAVYTALTTDDVSDVLELFERILNAQVRRGVVNALVRTFDGQERIEIEGNGWLVDSYYLVDWNAKMYYADEDPNEPDYERSSGGVTKDTTYELVRLNQSLDVDGETTVTIDGEEYTLTEREMLFLSKVTWLLNRRHYHPDRAFWRFTDRWADVDVDTGLPKENDSPDVDSFNL